MIYQIYDGVMEETQEENEKREKENLEKQQILYEAKVLQHYAVSLGAWYATKLEKDKSVITISLGAIGLLVAILSAKGVNNLYQVGFYIIAFLGFIVAAITAIIVFDKNADQIEKDINNKVNISGTLKKLDIIIAISFCVGVIFTIFVGISYGVSLYNKGHGDKIMAEERIEKVIKPFQGENIERSYSNSEAVRPAPPSGQNGNPGSQNQGNQKGRQGGGK
jgi:DMSO reductase anchor subunit